MKTLTIATVFTILAAGVFAQPAFADHSEAIVTQPENASLVLCLDTNECFVPTDVTIDVGGTVTWINEDIALHNLASGTIRDTEGVGDLFGSPTLLMPPGDEYSFTFDDFEPGTYPYFCFLHPHMSGTVTVVAAGEDGDMMMMEASATGMLEDGTMVKVYATEPAEGERMEISVTFADSEHVNYDLMVTQNGEEVLSDAGAHEHMGMGEHMTAPLPSSDPVDITITFQGYGVAAPLTGPIGEEVAFTNVVPEFGTVAMIILGVAITSIIAVTARSRITPRI
ncbi:Plastocyanin [Geodia barretti]|uniref:Plastocyanin n=1 Tax=Geodia barretti TaxID=519541 RepID=A0AA35TN14_GEOBA|nr:Plastocyanin [Geodia barretti]